MVDVTQTSLSGSQLGGSTKKRRIETGWGALRNILISVGAKVAAIPWLVNFIADWIIFKKQFSYTCFLNAHHKSERDKLLFFFYRPDHFKLTNLSYFRIRMFETKKKK